MRQFSRSFLVLLIAVFAVQIAEVPPSRMAANPKTCCGRTICRCTHAPGAKCHFHHTRAGAGPRALKIPAPGSSFREAPCHQNSPKVAVPGWYRDYEVQQFLFIDGVLSWGAFYPLQMPAPVSLTGAVMERPPKSF